MELRDSASTFADLRITNKLASVAPQLAALPEATREAIAQREVTPYARSLVRGLPRGVPCGAAGSAPRPNTALLWTRAAAHLAEGRRPWRDTNG